MRIRQEVAPDRRVSVEDSEMRHGRKSQSKRFNGFKQHIAAEVELDLIVACTVTPANRPEAEATPALQKDMKRQGIEVGELYIDRGYINSSVVGTVQAQRGRSALQGLAHLSRRQGRRAGYRGVRKNVFDLRRAAVLQNIESWQRHLESTLARAQGASESSNHSVFYQRAASSEAPTKEKQCVDRSERPSVTGSTRLTGPFPP